MGRVRMAGSRFPFLPPGNYVCQIDTTRVSDRKGSYVVELVVMQSDNPNVHPGSKHSWIQGCSDLDIALPSIKRFIIAAVGCNTEEEAAAKGHDLAQLTDASQSDTVKLVAPNGQPNIYNPNPLKGCVLLVNVQPPQPTANNPNSKFQRHNFNPVQR